MAVTTKYFRGQGKVFVATRDAAGKPLAFRELGDCEQLKAGLTAQTQTKKENTSGSRLTALRYSTGNDASIEFKCNNISGENYAFAFRGNKNSVAAGTVTGELAPPGLVAGDVFFTDKSDVSSLVITDSAGTPATLTLGTNYKVNNLRSGEIEIINPAALVQPFKKAYSNALVTSVPFFEGADQPYWFRFVGLNDIDSNRPVIVDFYKVNFDPAKPFDLISDAPAQFDLSGAPVYDDTKAADAVLGKFGRVQLLA